MDSHNQPFKIARFDGSGIGQRSWGDWWNMEANGSNGGGEGSPHIGLGLELGRRSVHRSNTCRTESCGFTIFQLQELQLQSLIYKYIEAGISVPYHLVSPIWNSVANSLAGLNGGGGAYQLFPSFLGCGPMNLEYRNGMDPEPGRCRRTDGKKWRCSKEAVPDKKYCERHIHRGRQRSRKLVEASQGTTSNSTTSTSTSTNLSISLPVSSTSSGSSSTFSPRFGFSPKSVLHGGTQKTEPSL